MQIGGLGSEVWLGTLLARTTSVPLSVTISYKVLIVAENIAVL